MALVALGFAGSAYADPTPSPTNSSQSNPLQVVVTQLLPRAPQPHDPLEITGHLTNLGTSVITNISVRLRVGNVIRYRGDLDDADTNRPATTQVSSTVTLPLATTLAAGASTSFDLRTDLNRLQIDQEGVYPVDIEARGNRGDGTDNLGLAPTWIPFFPGGDPQPIRVAVVWPIIDKPRQDPDGAFLDDALAGSMIPQGRLGGLVAAGRAALLPECGSPALGPLTTKSSRVTRCDPVPVTWAVDPDLLSAASTMEKGYRVRRNSSGDKTTPGAGAPVATTWLASLRAGTVGSELLALPYADPDVTALAATHGGNDDLAKSAQLGRSTAASILQSTPLDSVAWPPDGPVSSAGQRALALTGARSFVLGTSAFVPLDSRPNQTPNARTVLGTSDTGVALTGLVADSYLSDLVTGPGANTLGPRLAEQRFLAETAIIAAERPSNRTRTLLIAPERRTNVNAAAAAETLRDLGRVPWLCPVSLSSLAAADEHCGSQHTGTAAAPTSRGAASTATAGLLPARYLAGVATSRDTVAQLTDAVLSDAADTTIRTAVATLKLHLGQAIARAESSAWRASTSQARSSAALLEDGVARLTSKIVVRGGRALLTSSKGTLQVSVENTLAVPIDIRVLFSSDTATLGSAETGIVDVPAGHAVQAAVKAQPRRSGQFVVFAQIVDRNGKPFGTRAEVIVRSTQFGRLALAVTIGGISVLFIAAGVRIFRRALPRSPKAPSPVSPSA